MKSISKMTIFIGFRVLIVVIFVSLAMRGYVVATDTLTGKYEISYIYNSMYGGGANGPHNPEGVQYYGNSSTYPIQVTLEPGTYYAKIVPGRETGNLGYTSYGYVTSYWGLISSNNPSAAFPETGYDGGNTWPDGDPLSWWYAVAIWVGTSTAPTDGTFSVLGGLGNTYTFTIAEGQSVWLYWHDWWILDNLGGVTVELWKVQVEIPVSIDIKPGSFPNSINPGSKGRIPVAILTTATFGAATVNPNTVLFGKTGTEAAPVQVAMEDVDGDGDIDMILHFNTQETGIVCGDTSAYLIGKTYTGQTFKGSDSVNTVGCK